MSVRGTQDTGLRLTDTTRTPVSHTVAQQHSTQHTMTKNALDEADLFTTPGDTSISIDDEYGDDCVMMIDTTTTIINFHSIYAAVGKVRFSVLDALHCTCT